MSRTRSLLLAVMVLALGPATASDAAWTHFANTVRTPDGNLAHTDELVQMFVLGTDIESSQACVVYKRETDKPRQGRVLVSARFNLPDGAVEEVNFVGGVAKNEYSKCKEGPAAPVGTLVEYTFDFRGMPRILGNKGQYTDVSGVVADGEPEVETLGLTPAEDGRGRINSASSIFTADKASQRHPLSLAHTAIANRLLVEPTLCVSYQRTARKRNKGRIVSEVNVTYPDGETERLRFSGGVRKNEFIRCRQLSRDAPLGTMAENDLAFLGMPRLRQLDANSEYALVNTSISTAGDVAFRTPPAVPDPPADDDPGGDDRGTPEPPPPPPGGGSGALTDADKRCISRVLLAAGSGARQIVRPKGNRGGKFEVFGPRSLISGGQVVTSTLGFGSTYAAACADYERKRGNIGPEGPPLSARDVANFIWYSNMNSSAGPTAVRRDPRGGFHADYWRPSTGPVIVNVSSPSAAIEALRRAGL